jgi:diaminohydroxyphosphoribosylaminopyrimidine deaminase/5-amino-6-(5-phosphoribosylamino)uracil reductase
MAFKAQDERFMRRALALARRGLGKTSPNPVVGAVLVKDGRIIAEDYHKRAGGPHAEVLVLRKAGRRACGTTLYVTMEPCCTWGKTPPCTEAIITAGVKRVVAATLDRNPKHDGHGLTVLRRAGIRVEHSLLADEATRMNAAFNKWITTGQPLVIAKAAMSVDGKIATRTGDSKWITSEAARRKAHNLRARVDAIMVGANTVIRDDPRLTLRYRVRGSRAGLDKRQPWRVVVDLRGRCPRSARLFTDSLRHRTIVFTTHKSPTAWRRHLALRGIIIIVVQAKGGRVDLRSALRELGRMEATSVMVEGGGELLGSLFDAGLIDRVALFYAPLVIGGREAVKAVGGKGVAKVAQAVRLSECRWRKIGKSEMLLEAKVAR